MTTKQPVQRWVLPAVWAALLVCLFPAQRATATVMDFEGLITDPSIVGGEGVEQYYNGGVGSLGSGPGPDFDIGYAVGGSTVVDAGDIGATAVSGSNIVTTFEVNGDMIFSLVGPLSDLSNLFSFYYVTARNDATVTLYDGLDATGSVIGSTTLAATGAGFNWTFLRLKSIPGTTIGSVKIHLAVTGSALFDDVGVTVPAPATLSLFGLAAMLGWRYRRRQTTGLHQS